MPEGMLECPSGSFMVSLLPTFLAFWKGEGPWRLAALVMSLVSFVVFVLWTTIAANLAGNDPSCLGTISLHLGTRMVFRVARDPGESERKGKRSSVAQSE
jgi:hypothetical protein